MRQASVRNGDGLEMNGVPTLKADDKDAEMERLLNLVAQNIYQDAERYRFLRSKVFARQPQGFGSSGQEPYFMCVNIPQRISTDVMKGSIAGHMDAEIDHAIQSASTSNGASTKEK